MRGNLPSVELRPPFEEESESLAALCRRAKATWGYDEAFLDACEPVLRVDPELAARAQAVVAEIEGVPVGVAQVRSDGQAVELELMFVEPTCQGRGVGRALFEWARTRARELGASSMTILADPGARGFYERMGARFERMAPSDAIRGRELPLLRHPLPR